MIRTALKPFARVCSSGGIKTCLGYGTDLVWMNRHFQLILLVLVAGVDQRWDGKNSRLLKSMFDCIGVLFPLNLHQHLCHLIMFSMIGNQSDQLISLHGQITTLKLENETLREQLQVCNMSCGEPNTTWRGTFLHPTESISQTATPFQYKR